jgi:hypothetical protein
MVGLTLRGVVKLQLTELNMISFSFGAVVEGHRSPDTHHVTASVNAYEGERRVFAKAWAHQIPRDLV